MLRKERQEYKQRNSNSMKQSSVQTIQELQQKGGELESLISPCISADNGSSISQVTTGSAVGTIMGGRNEQIRKKSNPKKDWQNSNISISTVQ